MAKYKCGHEVRNAITWPMRGQPDDNGFAITSGDNVQSPGNVLVGCALCPACRFPDQRDQITQPRDKSFLETLERMKPSLTS